jgi:regulator of replication initiation timing
MLDFVLIVVCIALAVFSWRLKTQKSELRLENERLNLNNEQLRKQVEEAVSRLAEHEASSYSDGLFQRVVEGLVGLA